MRLSHAGEKSMQAFAKQALLKGTKTCKLEALCIGQEDKDEVCTVIHCTREFLILCIQIFGVPLKMHLLEENTILSHLYMIALGGLGIHYVA